jgi:hypothetical protein
MNSDLRHSFRICLIAGLPVIQLLAEAPPLPNRPTFDAKGSYQLVERGPHHRVWAQVISETNRLGKVYCRTNGYTELQVGVSVQDSITGQWRDSSPDFHITKEGYALATLCQHQVIVSPNVNAAGGAVDLQLPGSAGRLRSGIIGLNLFDPVLGKSVQIAAVKDCAGQQTAGNEITFFDAFQGLKADVRIRNTPGSFHQEVILREKLTPEQMARLGFDPRTARVETWTEFFSAPAPTVRTTVLQAERDPGARARMADPDTVDQFLDWGAMKMVRGKAFVEGAPNKAVPVFKEWMQAGGRRFLIEAVTYGDLEPLLTKLPSTKTAALKPANAAHRLLANRTPPERTARGGDKTFHLAKLESAKSRVSMPQVILDYDLSGSLSNFTAQPGVTYKVVGAVLLSGITRISPCCVFKYPAGEASLEIASDGAVKFLTSALRPAVFTAVDDDSIGAQIAESTGVPSNYYGSAALIVNPSGIDLHDLRITFLQTALSFPSGGAFTCTNLQVGKCASGVEFGGSHAFFGNGLVFDTGDVFTGSPSSLVCENVTFHNCGGLIVNPLAEQSAWLSLTNCLLAAVTNLGAVYTEGRDEPLTNSFTTNCTAIVTSDGGVFQAAGAGRHYLAADSPYRNAGTTNISPGLLTTLRQRTTYPPLLRSNVLITADTTLAQEAQRDVDGLDLGWHYSAIDYLVSCCVSNATLALTNGVVLGYCDSLGVWLHNGARLVSCGNPVRRNYLLNCSLVQEQPVNLASPYGSGTAVAINPWHTDSSRNPSINLRFTTWLVSPGALYVVYTGEGGWETAAAELRDCEVYAAGASWWQYNNPSGSVVHFHNNLFQETCIDIATSAQVTTRNNLFTGPTQWVWLANWGTAPFTNTDNAFDGCWVCAVDGEAGHNAYLNGATPPDSAQPGDITTNLTWVGGALGTYYQPANSPLIDAGSVSNAAWAGLYDYTTTTNQVREGSSPLDISYHYIPYGGDPNDVDGDGVTNDQECALGTDPYNPDTDMDGVSDLVEYLQGRNPLIFGSVADTNNLIGLRIYTPLK